MKVFETVHQKKSAIITTLIVLILLFLFFVLGLTYLDPPISYGMEVNFGNSSIGSGLTQPREKATAKTTSVAKPKKVEIEKKSVPQQDAVEEKEVITEKESPVAVKSEENNREVNPAKLNKVVEKVIETKEEPEVSETTKNVLSNLLNSKDEGKETRGEGTDLQSGDKGKYEGNPYANTYYNNQALTGAGKGYGLSGRNLQSSGKVVQECNEEGIVVVRVTVNRKGDVILAEPGVKGTTNTSPCLLKPAKETALLHKWYPDPKAPAKQIGFVVIQFKLGE